MLFNPYLYPLCNWNTLGNIIMIFYLCRTGHDNVSLTRGCDNVSCIKKKNMAALMFMLFELFPLVGLFAIMCLHHYIRVHV